MVMDLPNDDVPLGLDIKRQKSESGKKKKQTGGGQSLQAKRYRKQHKIKVAVNVVSNKAAAVVPAPVEQFDLLANKPFSFSPTLLNNLTELAYKVPTPVQAQTIPVMVKRNNLLACAPTGSGKTAAYLLPILNEYTQCINDFQCTTTTTTTDESDEPHSAQPHKIQLFGLILAPTQELVRQIWSEAMRLSHNLSVGHFIAHLKRKHYAERGKKTRSGSTAVTSEAEPLRRRVRELRLPRTTRILVATPCRMGVLLSLDSSQCPFDLSRLSWLIIDECDKMLQMDLTTSTVKGKRPKLRSFRDQMSPVFHALQQDSVDNHQPQRNRSGSVRVALFSATIPDEVSQWARSELPQLLSNSPVCGDDVKIPRLVELYVGKRNSAVSTVSQELRYCATEEGKLLEMRFLLVRGLTYPCLIFMESRERAKDLVKEILLSDSDVLANVISGDKTEAQRAAVIRAFREGQLNVLVCTDLLGRGIDFKGVSMVVNYDLPPSKEEYIHRVGRTGRAGHRGKAITLWTDADLPYLGDILKVIRRSGSEVDPELERLVKDWQQRRSQMVLGKRDREPPPNVIISRRRGERRLVHEVLHQNKSGEDETSTKMPTKSLKWFRRWNPYRKPIHDLASARATRSMAEQGQSGSKRNRIKKTVAT